MTDNCYLQQAHAAPRELILGPSRFQQSKLRPKLSTWTTRYQEGEITMSSYPAISSCSPGLPCSTTLVSKPAGLRKECKLSPGQGGQSSWQSSLTSMGPSQLPCVMGWAAGTARDLLEYQQLQTSLHTLDWSILPKAEQAASNGHDFWPGQKPTVKGSRAET